MPSFTVTTAGQRVNLDAAGTAKASFTVTNTSAQTLKGRLLPRPYDPAKPEWFSIVGESVRDFASNATEQVVVQLNVPPTSPPGSYSFRLDAVSAVEPDEDYMEGPSVAFDVAAPPPPPGKKKFPWWILAIVGAVVLLIIIGVVIWLLVQDDGTKVVSSGNVTIATDQLFDVDAGKAPPAEARKADVVWQLDANGNCCQVAPAPQTNATLFNIGDVDFESIDAEQLSKLPYTADPILAGDLDRPGHEFAVHSGDGNFAKVEVLVLATELGLQWVTYHVGG